MQSIFNAIVTGSTKPMKYSQFCHFIEDVSRRGIREMLICWVRLWLDRLDLVDRRNM